MTHQIGTLGGCSPSVYNMAMKYDASDYPQNLRLAKKLAWILDDAFTLPMVKQRIGLDPILGLIPGGGDLVTFILGVYILWVAYDLEVPQKTLKKMAFNLLMDYLIGILPLVGDALDVFWRPNSQNFRLIEAHYHQTQSKKSTANGPVIDVDAVIN